MRTQPLMTMLIILIALAVMMGIYLMAYRYYRKSRPRDHSSDR